MLFLSACTGQTLPSWTKGKIKKEMIQNDELNTDELILFFKALANDDRIKMIRMLKTTEMSVSEILKEFYLEQSTTSHHLNTLRNANILKCRKSGRHRYYSLDKERFLELWSQVKQLILNSSISTYKDKQE